MQSLSKHVLTFERDTLHDSGVHIHADLDHLFEDRIPPGSYIDAIDAPIVGIAVPLDILAVLQAINESAERHLAEVQDAGQFGLRDALVAMSGNPRQHPPLRASNSQRLHALVERGAPKTRDIVNQKANSYSFVAF